MVAACTVGNAVSVTPMVYTVFGLFLIPLTTEFGWSRAAISFVLTIIAVASALGYPVIGRLIDRHGARRIILAGNVLFAASIASVSLIGASLAHLYIAYALIGVTAAIPSSAMFTKVIASWFDRNRGLFLGIAGGLGNGTGAALSPVLAHLLISAFGWRGGFQGIALTVLVIGFPVLFLLLWDPPKSRETNRGGAPGSAPGQETAIAPGAPGRSNAGGQLSGAASTASRDSIMEPADAPAAPETRARSTGDHSSPSAEAADEGMTLAEARRTGSFWIILVAIALGAGCMTAVFAHVVPMLEDRGLPRAQATTVLATFSMVTAAWQIGVGYLLDRVPKPWIAAPFYLIALGGLALLQGTSSFPLLLLAGLLLGFGLGTEYGVLPYFISRYFGVRHYGAITGTAYAVVVLTQGVTPFLMALVFDLTGAYDLAMGVIAFGLALGALLIMRLKPFTYIPPRL